MVPTSLVNTLAREIKEANHRSVNFGYESRFIIEISQVF